MISMEKLMSFDKSNLPEAAESLEPEDLSQLVEWLSEKDDKVRYQSLLLLQHRSLHHEDVYPFWDIFCQKLKSENSYQRSIGLMLIADNAAWDKENRLDRTIDEYLMLLRDEKPITVRQCIQALCKVVPHKRHLHPKISAALMSIELSEIKETMRKLVLIDILDVLIMLRKYEAADEIDSYISDALTGGILDKKTIKQIQSRL